MSKRSFNPEQCISTLNNVKRGLQMSELPFTKETMLYSLKSCGLPTNCVFWSVFRNSGILQEVSKGKFMFSSKDPIYVGILQKIKTKYQELIHRYKQSSKAVEVKEVKPEETLKEKLPEDDPQVMTQSAINFLKERGYLVFAPTNIEYTMV